LIFTRAHAQKLRSFSQIKKLQSKLILIKYDDKPISRLKASYIISFYLFISNRKRNRMDAI